MRCSGQSVHLSLKIFLSVLLLFSAVFGKTEIILKKQVNVYSPQVKLSDVAFIKSDSQDFARFVGSIIVLQDIKAGQKKVLTKNSIKQVLSKNYIDPSKIEITGEKTVVERDVIKLNTAVLREKVISYLKERYPDLQAEDIRFSLKEMIFDSPYKLKILERSRTSSYLYIDVYVVHKGRTVRKIPVSVKYREFADTVVAKKDILKGQIITQEQITVKKLVKKRDQISDPKLVIGAKAKTNIPAGKVIKLSMIEPDYPVKKKSYVKVIYDRNGIKIEVTGIALENGQKGQIIKVKNPSTGKVLSCRVLGKDTVLFIGGM